MAAAFSTSRPVVSAPTPARTGSPRSRLRVSRDSWPMAVSVSRRRDAANTTATARTRKTTMRTIRRVIGGLGSRSELEEQARGPRRDEVEARATKERADDDEDGPEHEEHREQGDRELAVLGLGRRVLVHVGGEDQQEDAHAR